jgi:hypothetical protein
MGKDFFEGKLFTKFSKGRGQPHERPSGIFDGKIFSMLNAEFN